MEKLEPVSLKIKAFDFEGALGDVREIWNQIPDPKDGVLNTYLLVEYAAGIFFLKMGQMAEAMAWAKLGLQFNQSRQDCGESEFLIGKIYFLDGNIEEAKHWLSVSFEKSNGRIFIGENPELRRLIIK